MGITNGQAFKTAITQKMLSRLKGKGSTLEARATKLQQDSILFFRAYETGEMHDAAKSQMTVTSNSAIIKFQNPMPQATYVTLGLGGNRPYGPRNFLMYAISLFLQSIGSGTGFLLSAGQPRRSSTLAEGALKPQTALTNKRVVSGIARVAKRNKDTR